jgi:hypothetical protein
VFGSLHVGTFERWNVKIAPNPRFFVSVASKGFSIDVSLLFATLTGRPIRVANKGVGDAEQRKESKIGKRIVSTSERWGHGEGGYTPPITWMNVKTKGIENGQFVSE